MLWGLEDLSQIPRIAQFLPGIHLHQTRRGSGNKGRVRCCRYLRNFREQFDVLRAVIKMIVADQAAIGLSAKLAIFLSIHFLKNGTLIPCRSLEFFQRFMQFLQAGGSRYTMDLFELAGLDMSGPGPVQAAFRVLGESVDQLERLALG